MSKITMNLQDSFLNQIRKEGSEVKVVMLDGSYLTGFVRGFDNFTVILYSRGNQHLLYKHAIAQLISRKPTRKEGDDSDTRRPPHEAPVAKPASKQPFNAIDMSEAHSE